ncbi:MAG: hypothetical protein ACLTSX_11735 [Collinsella sp.]
MDSSPIGGLEGLDVIAGAAQGARWEERCYELSHPLPGDAIKEVMAHYADMDVSFVISYRGVLTPGTILMELIRGRWLPTRWWI